MLLVYFPFDMQDSTIISIYHFFSLTYKKMVLNTFLQDIIVEI